jgi:predicted cupin superfamily sugar epimerase
MDANEVIEKFGLTPLPEEGGFYKETYRDSGIIPGGTANLEIDHSYSTCIYYLITPEEFSGLHAVKSTEIFHFYAGDPVEMVQITEDGELTKVVMGNDLTTDQTPQVIVSPHIWQGTKLLDGGKWALLGCTVAPGFEFSDFINGTYSQLADKFPEHKDIIKDYTHS